MDAVVGFLNNNIVLTVVQLVFGIAIKRLPALAAWPNKLIPLFNGLLALLIKLGGPGDAEAAVLGVSGAGLLNLILEAGAQTLLTTGIHSSWKNVWQNFAKASLKR